MVAVNVNSDALDHAAVGSYPAVVISKRTQRKVDVQLRLVPAVYRGTYIFQIVNIDMLFLLSQFRHAIPPVTGRWQDRRHKFKRVHRIPWGGIIFCLRLLRSGRLFLLPMRGVSAM